MGGDVGCDGRRRLGCDGRRWFNWDRGYLNLDGCSKCDNYYV